MRLEAVQSSKLMMLLRKSMYASPRKVGRVGKLLQKICSRIWKLPDQQQESNVGEGLVRRYRHTAQRWVFDTVFLVSSLFALPLVFNGLRDLPWWNVVFKIAALLMLVCLIIVAAAPPDSLENYQVQKVCVAILMMVLSVLPELIAGAVILGSILFVAYEPAEAIVNSIAELFRYPGFITLMMITLYIGLLVIALGVLYKNARWSWIDSALMFSIRWIIFVGLCSAMLTVVDLGLLSWGIHLLEKAPGNSLLLSGISVVVGVALSLSSSYTFSLIRGRKASVRGLRKACDDCLVVLTLSGSMHYAELTRLALAMDDALSSDVLSRINRKDSFADDTVRIMIMACFARIICSLRVSDRPVRGSERSSNTVANHLPCFSPGLVFTPYAQDLFNELAASETRDAMRSVLDDLERDTVPCIIMMLTQFLFALRKLCDS